MTKEVTVILKDSEKTCRQKFLIEEEIMVSAEDVIIRHCIAETKRSFEGEPEDIDVRIFLSVR